MAVCSKKTWAELT